VAQRKSRKEGCGTRRMRNVTTRRTNDDRRDIQSLVSSTWGKIPLR